jgi:hypothetical protein
MAELILIAVIVGGVLLAGARSLWRTWQRPDGRTCAGCAGCRQQACTALTQDLEEEPVRKGLVAAREFTSGQVAPVRGDGAARHVGA